MRRPSSGPWIGAHRRGHPPFRGKWKLHVSATPASAADVLHRALPVVLREGVPFKVAASPSLLEALNEGAGGISQVGKFMTVYPRDDAQAVRIAGALDEAVRGLGGPRVPTDRTLHPESIVSYRFAGRRKRRAAADPFVAAGVAEPDGPSAVGGRYVVVSPMHRSAGGSVDLAVDVEGERPCVLKRAGRDARPRCFTASLPTTASPPCSTWSRSSVTCTW